MYKTSTVLFWIIIICIFSACNKEVTFYVTNTSRFTRETTISVYLNDSIVLNQEFKYSDIVPNYDVFKFKLSSHINKLKVIESEYGITAEDSIDVKKDKYVFISFNEFKNNLPPGDTVKRQISILKRKNYTKLR